MLNVLYIPINRSIDSRMGEIFPEKKIMFCFVPVFIFGEKNASVSFNWKRSRLFFFCLAIDLRNEHHIFIFLNFI